MVIGSDAGADFQLTDAAVAPYQCELIANQDHAEVLDLAHKSNTLVNDLKIDHAQLHHSTSLKLGSTIVQFSLVSVDLFIPHSRDTRFGELVGASSAMRDFFAVLGAAAQSDSSVLIYGEAGTGKQTTAQAIHNKSLRHNGVFHAVDCQASYQKIEAALIQAFAQVGSGTLFLSEIGLLPTELQARLLHVFRMGGPTAVAGLRIISSSTVDLRLAVNEGRFCNQLFVNLRELEAQLPAMRQRFEDLPLLIDDLLARQTLAKEPMASMMRSREFQSQLQRYRWPGNVRELQEYLSQCLRHGTALPLDPTGMDTQRSGRLADGTLPEIDISKPIKAGREQWIKHFERLYLSEILESQGGNVTKAAKAANVDRGHFYRLMMRCGLR